MTRFLLIRHGNTDAVGNYLSGQAPGLHINKDGRAQVGQLVEVLRNLALTAVVSSPLERTRDTAEPIARDHGLEVIVDAAFIEFGVGEWTGETYAVLASNDHWRRFSSARSVTRPPGGELMIEVQQRSISALMELRRRQPSGTFVIVSHGDVIRAVLMYFLGTPIDLFERIEILPARISVVDVDDEGARVRQVNGDTMTLPA